MTDGSKGQCRREKDHTGEPGVGRRGALLWAHREVKPGLSSAMAADV